MGALHGEGLQCSEQGKSGDQKTYATKIEKCINMMNSILRGQSELARVTHFFVLSARIAAFVSVDIRMAYLLTGKAGTRAASTMKLVQMPLWPWCLHVLCQKRGSG